MPEPKAPPVSQDYSRGWHELQARALVRISQIDPRDKTPDGIRRECYKAISELRSDEAPIAVVCTDMMLHPGEFSGGRQIPCGGIMYQGRIVLDGCDEPCNFKKGCRP